MLYNFEIDTHGLGQHPLNCVYQCSAETQDTESATAEDSEYFSICVPQSKADCPKYQAELLSKLNQYGFDGKL